MTADIFSRLKMLAVKAGHLANMYASFVRHTLVDQCTTKGMSSHTTDYVKSSGLCGGAHVNVVFCIDFFR